MKRLNSYFVAMNFLAHLHLSGDDKDLRYGNFIGDGVRGNKFKDYPERISQGIMLHRYIDTFTDSHPVVSRSKDLLRPRFNHYSGIIVDIFYDHFLAKNWKNYSDSVLEEYVNDFYTDVMTYEAQFPDSYKRMVPFMIRDNWLESYATKTGIATVLYNMNNRTRGRSKMNLATLELDNHYSQLEEDFTEFYAALMDYVNEQIPQL